MQCSVGSTSQVSYRHSVRQPHAAHLRVEMPTKTIDKHAQTDSSAKKKKNPPHKSGYCTLDSAHVKLQLEPLYASTRTVNSTLVTCRAGQFCTTLSADKNNTIPSCGSAFVVLPFSRCLSFAGDPYGGVSSSLASTENPNAHHNGTGLKPFLVYQNVFIAILSIIIILICTYMISPVLGSQSATITS